MASSSSPSSTQELSNWSDLPPEITSSFMLRLGADEILENAQKVCRSWRRVSKDPSMWRKIDMQNMKTSEYDLDRMCRHAVDRSEGGLADINIGNIASDSLLNYIADRSPNLRSLGLEMNSLITNQGLVNAVSKLPLLEELEVTFTSLIPDLKAIGHSCPKLKTLKLEWSSYIPYIIESNDGGDGLAIAESMPQLHHLQIVGDRLNDTGLNAILDNCPHLEHLDLRKCHIKLSGDLERRCLERVKDFRPPNDSPADYLASFLDFDEQLLKDLAGEPDFSGGDYDYY